MIDRNDELVEAGHPKRIFVFGSNTAGRHGKGSALHAKLMHGAVQGVGRGFTGNCYALPTRAASNVIGSKITTLPLAEIAKNVDEFLLVARGYPELDFEVTKIGCGLAGYPEEEIAPLFKHATNNCHLPEGWREYNLRLSL